MKVCILGGDKRQLEIIKSLEKNHDVILFGYENLSNNIKKSNIKDIDICEYDVIIFPTSGVNNDYSVNTIFGESFNVKENLLNNTKQNALIFTGVMTDRLDSMLKESNRQATILMEDKEVVKENTIPTVEGIIADIIYNTDITINNSNILVIGYGNIGKRLVPFLKTMGAKVSVGVNNESDFHNASIVSDKVIYTSSKQDLKEVLGGIDIVVNTAPALVLDKECLNNTNKSSYILDVSSYPYGIDFKSADEIGLKNKLFPGIPSKVAPKTAGLILTKKIEFKMKGEE